MTKRRKRHSPEEIVRKLQTDETAKKMQTNVRCDLVTTGVPPHRNRAATVHLADALLLEILDASQPSESPARSASTRMGPVDQPELVNYWG